MRISSGIARQPRVVITCIRSLLRSVLREIWSSVIRARYDWVRRGGWILFEVSYAVLFKWDFFHIFFFTGIVVSVIERRLEAEELSTHRVMSKAISLWSLLSLLLSELEIRGVLLLIVLRLLALITLSICKVLKRTVLPMLLRVIVHFCVRHLLLPGKITLPISDCLVLLVHKIKFPLHKLIFLDQLLILLLDRNNRVHDL